MCLICHTHTKKGNDFWSLAPYYYRPKKVNFREDWCTTIHEMSKICMWMIFHIPMKGWAPRLALRKRHTAIWKWPIIKCRNRNGFYNYQLSKARLKFRDRVLTFNLCCGHTQLVPFPVANSCLLTPLAAKCEKLQAMVLLPLEMRKVACGNTVIFVTPYLTDNRNKCPALCCVNCQGTVG